ncbi:MAG: T9SS type A sorting domain-containing protein [Candidatus Marinimicrobia bacterium]|jgi:Tol biopolymer transport system component|nr:T9SS type A sorting domain-containing protein [Candidatus Neomarinimicrobiota bacterium]MBT3617524.1 T9SS type A sorting domain-containing protein [Candidatus Neomarinimicrobiota bacterium]MBT4280325.1 T9SS type A sorting domain-containing protein [Candidatus Neomarinimicrobiota bacterium]MBT4796649.1 T9SS type A sorting domain-containing protein [Candidatus Neomarinimicrobiota bacterium]MBT6000606.1 T9SS type A sorting domain-containing protein [Candidatus Neomarinimicrobiota bacterium]
MKNILLITILTSFCLSQSEEWIYFNNMTNYEWGVGMDFSVNRISPDGSVNEIILEDVRYSDLSEDGTKLLYVNYELIGNMGWDQLGPVSFSIYNTETSDTISSITGIYPTNPRFTHDENIVLYMEGSQYSNWQLYKYSFADSSITMLSDSLSSAFDNMALSPNGQQVLYFKLTEDEDTEDYFMDVDVIVADIESGETTILATIPYLVISGNGIWVNNPIWSDNGFIYLTFLDDNNCAQLFGIHSTYGYITQLTDNPCTGEIGYYCIPSILKTKETDLDKFVYTTCSDTLGSNEHWIYDIASNESSYLGYFGGDNFASIAMGQSWSPDGTKVVFNEWLFGGMILIPGHMRIYDTVTESIDTVGNALNIDDPESYYAASPVIWFAEAEVNVDEPTDILPTQLSLEQNYPNPFNPTTTLRYDLPENSQVIIMIYDIMGREVRTLVNNQQSAGYKSVVWNATNNLGQPVSAGMYLYRISAGEFHSVKKMVLMK